MFRLTATAEGQKPRRPTGLEQPDYPAHSFGPVKAYLGGEFAKVNGWCDAGLWQVIQPLVEAIIAEGGRGPIAEIGVYHGKFFIGLLKTMNVSTANYAIDVFDMQQFNKDNAGKGDLDTFKRNLKASGVADSEYEILKTDSTWIDADLISELKSKTGGFSMFSVDGCHTVTHTINDMKHAMALTRPSGVIFVDDYYNDFWPEVHEAVALVYASMRPTFVPVATICDKLVLCGISYHDIYLKHIHAFIKRVHPDTKWKIVKQFGHNCLAVRPKARGASIVE